MPTDGFSLSFSLQHLKYHSEIMSLHGFHFEVKATKDDTGSKYSFYLQVCSGFFRKALKLFLHFLIKLAKLFTWETKSFVCFVLPAFLDTARLPRGNRHEWDSQVPCKVPWLVGLARRVIHPVESPFFDGRVTLLAGQTFRLFAFSPFRKHFGTLSRVNSVKARQSEYARALS